MNKQPKSSSQKNEPINIIPCFSKIYNQICPETPNFHSPIKSFPSKINQNPKKIVNIRKLELKLYSKLSKRGTTDLTGGRIGRIRGRFDWVYGIFSINALTEWYGGGIFLLRHFFPPFCGFRIPKKNWPKRSADKAN